jgi:fructan beta-fructosidase
MYPDNPVIPNLGRRDFRDPKVFWHEASHHWVMIVAGGDRVMFYTSANLREWVFASEFGELTGAHTGMWECPDLFELTIEDEPASKRWVMLVSVLNGSPNGGSGTQYFIGDFDGTAFSNSFSAAAIHWVDYGRDNYAGVTFSDIPGEDGRRICLGWMNNWFYALYVPTSPWRGAMTIPRQLVLQTSHTGQLQLVSRPVTELQALRRRGISVTKQIISDASECLVADSLIDGTFEIIVEYHRGMASEFGLIVGNEHGDRTVIGYSVAAQKIFVDRRNSGVIDFNNSDIIDFSGGFAFGVDSAPLVSGSDIVKLHVFVDWSSIEIFADDGHVLLTDLVLPRHAYNRLELYAKGGEVQVRQCDVWELATVWTNQMIRQ